MTRLTEVGLINLPEFTGQMSDFKRRSRCYFQVGGEKIQISSCLERST